MAHTAELELESKVFSKGAGIKGGGASFHTPEVELDIEPLRPCKGKFEY